MTHQCASALLLLLLCGASHALPGDATGERSALSVAAANLKIQQRFPVLRDRIEFAHGDIDRDGIEDAAAIVRHDDNGVDRESIVLLKGNADGGYSFMAESLPSEPLAQRSLKVKDGSVLVTVREETYEEYSATTYRFRLHSGQPVLAGLDYECGKAGGKTGVRISADFITGKAIEWRDLGKKRKLVYRNLKRKQVFPLETFAFGGTGDPAALELAGKPSGN